MTTVSDIAFFCLVVKHGSISGAAQELGITPPAASKRLAVLERRLGVRLLNRTTRRTSLTHEGEVYLTGAKRILEETDELERTVTSARAVPKGLLKVNATLGFGRHHIGPALAAFVRRYPEIDVQLYLSDRSVNLTDQGFDVGIWVGGVTDLRITAVRIASNRRLLCAAPAYLNKFGSPTTPKDLQRHNCIVIRESDAAYGTWRLQNGNRHETVKVRGNLSSNDGEATVTWALLGLGILLRSEWEIAPYLRSGRLVQVLKDWRLPPADIHAVYPERANLSAKVRTFIDFLRHHFAKHLASGRSNNGGW